MIAAAAVRRPRRRGRRGGLPPRAQEPGDISNPRRAVHRRRADAGPEGRSGRSRSPTSSTGPTTATRRTTGAAFEPAAVPRAVPPVWKRKAPALLEFPPVMAGRIFQLADNGQLVSRKTTRQDAVEEQARPAGGVLARARGRPRLRDAARRRPLRPRADRRAALRDGKRRWSRTLPSRSESSPLVHGGRMYFGSENGTLYCLDAHRQGALDLPRGGRDQGQPDASRTASCSSATTAGASRPCGRATGRGLEQARGRRRCAAALLRDGGGGVRARVHRQHRRPRLRALGQERAPRLVAPDRALRLLLGGGQPRRRAAGRRCSSAPTTAASTRSTRAPATCAGRTARAARSPARRRSSATSSTSPTSAARHDRPGTRSGRVAFRTRRRLRPGHLRRQAPLPDRQPLADGARAAAAVQKREKAKQAVRKKKAAARALVAPAWPEECRQLAPCGPLTAVRDRRIRMRG